MDLNFSIINIKPATTEEWDQAWQECPYACFSQSSQWYALWERHYNFHAEALSIDTNRGLFILPIAYLPKLKGLHKHYYSSPFGTYGGVLGSTYLDNAEIKQIYMHVEKQLKIQAIEITGNPYHNSANSGTNFTHIFDLSIETEGFLNSLSYNARRKFRDSFRYPLALVKASYGDAAFFAHFYQQKWKEWQNTGQPYGIDFFTDLMQMACVDSWILKDVYGNIILIGICLQSKKSIQCWLYASLNKYLTFKPYQSYFYHLMEYYREKKWQILDLNPSGNLTSVAAAKDFLGAKRLYFDDYKSTNGCLPVISQKWILLKSYLDKA